MGGQSRVEELNIQVGPCAALVVEASQLRAGSSRVAALADHLRYQSHRLARVDDGLARAAEVPGGLLSAAPARGALAVGAARVRSVIAEVERLAALLERTASNYESAESATRRLFEGVQVGAGGWRNLYGTWLPSPMQLLTAPLSRYYTAGAIGQLDVLTGSPWSLLAGPHERLGAIFGRGSIHYSQITALSPTGWFHYARSAFHTGRLLPKALGPVWDRRHSGLDRAEGALLGRSLSGVVVPGGDVGQGAGVAAGFVAAVHRGLGHRRIRMEQIPPRGADLDPSRAPVRTFAGAVSVMEELAVDSGAAHGELRIDRITSPAGEDSWQVFIPGGQGLDPGNVHSLLHSVSAVDANPTPSMAMVAAALREVGARKGEPIVITGHSHGGITGSMFANDPRMRAEFDVPLVITAGSPVDRHEIRPDTHVVSIEHTEDFVPGLDGVERTAKPGMTRVERTLSESGDPAIAGGAGVFHTHDYPNYVDTARLADAHPDLEHVRAHFAAVIPEGRVETYRFRAEITR